MNRTLCAGGMLLALCLPLLAAPAPGRMEGMALVGGKPAYRGRLLVEQYDLGPNQGFRAEVETAPSGRFVLMKVPPGKYRVSRLLRFVQSTGEGQSETVVPTHGLRAEVTAGDTTRVTVGEAGATVVGRLQPGRGLDGRRLAYTAGDFRFLTLKEPRTDGFPGRVFVLSIQEDGTFRCEDLPAGEYGLLVTAKAWDGRLDGPDIARATRTVRVPADREKPVDLGAVQLEAAP